jgi:hypothetical protein
VYWPVTDGGTPIYVHSKVLVVDERLTRVGSSNLNNRSMDSAAGEFRLVGQQLECEHLGGTEPVAGQHDSAHERQRMPAAGSANREIIDAGELPPESRSRASECSRHWIIVMG